MTSKSEPVSLAADFPPASREQWRALVAQVVARSGAAEADDPEAALASSTYDGYSLKPLYTADDLPPGFVATPGAARPEWDVRQHYVDPDPGRLNRAIRADLDNGVTSVWLAVGARGVAVADLDRALAGVLLELAPIVLDAGAESAAAAPALLDLAAQRGVSAADLGGSLGLDPIGTQARTGEPADLAGLLELAELTRDFPRLAAITIDGTVYHDRGGSDAEELAIVAAVTVAYLRALTDGGWTVADALARIECRYAVTADQFGSIAKLRAARQIWARIAELCGAPATARTSRQHATTSRAMLTRRDPWVNLLRATVAGFAAATGGADVITVEPFDSAIGIPDDFGRRLARNTQAILHDESSVARVSDPGGGSWYVEARTEQLAEAAWAKFTAIERLGGALAALDRGHLQGLLGATNGNRSSAIAHRRDPITGVSEFAFLDEELLVREPYPSARYAGGLWPHRWAETFETLRDRADAVSPRPMVFVAALGPAATNSDRVGFARNLFKAGGVETVIGAGELDQLVAGFTATGSAVACLCGADQTYAAQAADVAASLVAAGATQVWLAGRPGERADADAVAGITGYLYTGCDAVHVLHQTFIALAVR